METRIVGGRIVHYTEAYVARWIRPPAPKPTHPRDGGGRPSDDAGDDGSRFHIRGGRG